MMARSRRTAKEQGRKKSKPRGRRKTTLWAIGVVLLVIAAALAGMIAGQGGLAPKTRERVVTSPEQVPRITQSKARRLLDRGEAVLYDTRATEQYQAKHAAGAISFPEADRETLVDLLPTDKVLIFY